MKTAFAAGLALLTLTAAAAHAQWVSVTFSGFVTNVSYSGGPRLDVPQYGDPIAFTMNFNSIDPIAATPTAVQYIPDSGKLSVGSWSDSLWTIADVLQIDTPSNSLSAYALTNTYPRTFASVSLLSSHAGAIANNSLVMLHADPNDFDLDRSFTINSSTDAYLAAGWVTSVAVTAGPVPEPAAYGAGAAFVLLLAATWRTKRKRMPHAVNAQE